jgi:glycosyltransferase involved in cell wall biosynthesis
MATIVSPKKFGSILHVLTSLKFGGVESQMLLVAKNSSNSVWEHGFCALGESGVLLNNLKTLDAQVHALNCKVKIPSASAILSLWLYFRRVKPTVVHLHGAEANFHGTIAARFAGIPVVIAEEIGIPRHSRRARKVFSWIYRRCDQVVAISQAVKDEIITMGEADSSKITVIYNPFEQQSFRAVPLLNGRLVLGFVGRLETVKNPIAAVEAIQILRDRGLNPLLRIIGEGSLRGDLERRITDLRLENHVVLCGFHPRPFELLQDCHFYLQPSLTEGFGLAICEAMSAGIPVIASAVGGAPEIIDHGKTGWLLEQPSPENLATTIEKAAKICPKSLASMGQNASAAVNEKFNVTAYLQSCDSLYNHLLCETKTAGKSS